MLSAIQIDAAPIIVPSTTTAISSSSDTTTAVSSKTTALSSTINTSISTTLPLVAAATADVTNDDWIVPFALLASLLCITIVATCVLFVVGSRKIARLEHTNRLSPTSRINDMQGERHNAAASDQYQSFAAAAARQPSRTEADYASLQNL
jgi:hypothetical protein